MKNFIKGLVVGIGKIIPGVSGAMLAISMGIYDKSLDFICSFRNNIKESIKYLFPIGLGIVLSIIFFSRVLSICLEKFYFVTMLFFVGLIIGGIPMIVNKVKKNNYYIAIISFIIFFIISIGNINNIYIIKNNMFDLFVFFLSGIVDAVGTVVPGISSTALLMIMGTYNGVISSIGNLRPLNILLPFGFGLIIGLVVIAKVVNYLFRKYEDKMYAFILGILLSSVILLIIQSFKYGIDIIHLIIGLLFMIFGIFISTLLKEK